MKKQHILLAALAALFATAAYAQATVTPTPAVSSSIFKYLSGDVLIALFGLVTGILAIVKNSQLTTLQKVTKSVVIGVETATKIPAVQAFEDTVKATIHDKAVQLGVADDLHKIVQDLTGPSTTA